MEVVPYLLQYHKEITGDLKSIDSLFKIRIANVIQKKITSNPVLFGESLRSNLVGFRRLRVGDYRVIYRIKEEEKTVYIITIGHRRYVYKKASDRT